MRYDENARIYVVVAEVVQHPVNLASQVNPKGITFLFPERMPETRDIVQPPGRQFAQGVHASGRMRDAERKAAAEKLFEGSEHLRAIVVESGATVLWPAVCPDVTTITKSCRDSCELFHVRNLLEVSGIPAFGFEDENPDAYGPGKVVTAICTPPVLPEEVFGILDYLPLWGENLVRALPATATAR